jgi:PAS domain S-box-containing protein
MTTKPRLSVALVGEGDDLGSLVASLHTRSRQLRIEIQTVIDLSSSGSTAELVRELAIPVFSSKLETLAEGDVPGLVIMSSALPDGLQSIRNFLPIDVPVLGPDQADLVQGLIRLVEENRALAVDSRHLKETRRQLNLFVVTAPLAIYIKDTEFKYLQINSHALHVLGFREEQVVGNSDENLYPEKSVDWLRKLEQEAIETGTTLCATGILPAPGQEMHAQVTIFPITENRRTVGIYGLVEDTTELFESEQKLHEVDEQLDETQKYLREILGNSRDMIFLTDPRGKILSFNAGAEKALGYSPKEVIGQPANLLCENPAKFDILFNKALSDGHASRYETHFKAKDGHSIITNISLTLINDQNDEPLELVCLCRDITRRLQLKNDLIRSERLAAVGRMASGVAHEINNPLAVIDTIAGLVEESLADEGHLLAKETQDILTKAMQRLHHQVSRCTKITHSLLGFVRKSQTGMAPINLNDLLTECIELLGVEIKRIGATITTQFDPEVPIFRSDPMLIQQVFVNLLKNALDATEEVPDRKNKVSVVTQWDNERIIISVEDNGIGIRLKDQDRIFDLFHTTKPTGKGTGLGLSIVHDILIRLGGNIRVASVPGKWSRFLVELPVVPPAEIQPDPMSLEL